MTEEWSTHDYPMRPISPTLRVIADHWLETDLGDMILPRPIGLLVGEQPRPGGNPKLPLWPWPKNCAGERLFRMSGMTMVTYLTKVARVNMSREPVARWNKKWAERRAEFLLRGLPEDARVILCGSRARDAFGLSEWFEMETFHTSLEDMRQDGGVGPRAKVVAIPHPSGRNELYNDPRVRMQAGRWIRWAARI